MELFRELGVQVPELHKATYTCPIVTDREVAITNAITSMLPNLSLIFCWNHIFRDVRFWLRKHKVESIDISIYLEDAFQLFHQPSESSYNILLEERRKVWDAEYEMYYMTNIKFIPSDQYIIMYNYIIYECPMLFRYPNTLVVGF